MNRKERVSVAPNEGAEEVKTSVFLSDRLIEEGMKANPRSNMDMAKHAERMHELLKQGQEEGDTMKQLYNITVLACEKLKKAGYNFYTPAVFFTDIVKARR